MLRRIIGGSLVWLGRSLGKLAKMDRLDSIDAIALHCSIDDAIELYGAPLAKEKDGEFSEATEYTFRVSPFHDCVIWEWKQKIHAVVYYPDTGFPDADLEFMFETYGEGRNWNTVEEGFLYMREDNSVRLWCSAMPPIGVATMEYWKAKDNRPQNRPDEQ